MKKKLNQCSTASAKLRRQSLGSGPGAIGAHVWRAHVRACANASDGEEKSCVKSAGKCQKFKTVCNFMILVEVHVLRLSQQLASQTMRFETSTMKLTSYCEKSAIGRTRLSP